MERVLRDHRRAVVGVVLAFVPLLVGVLFGTDGVFLLNDIVAGILSLGVFCLVIGLLAGLGIRLVRG